MPTPDGMPTPATIYRDDFSSLFLRSNGIINIINMPASVAEVLSKVVLLNVINVIVSTVHRHVHVQFVVHRTPTYIHSRVLARV